MKINVKKLDPKAIVPTYGNTSDAGMDFYALEEITFLPGEQKRVHTGIAMEIPNGYVGLIWDKSKIAFQYGLKTAGGVIDAGFRGEIQVAMINMTDTSQTITQGQKFAQMLIQPITQAQFVEVGELSETERGAGREGSTGTH